MLHVGLSFFLHNQMLEGDPPFSNFEPYEAARRVAEGQRPVFRTKGIHPDLKK